MFGKKNKELKKDENETTHIKPEIEGEKETAIPSKEDEAEGQLTLDVYQTPDDIVIKSTIAGVRPENLDIAINNDMLTIKGSRTKGEEIKEEDYFYQECYWGSFSRSVILPVEVETGKIKAVLKDGILTVTLPKSKKARARKIEVQVSHE